MAGRAASKGRESMSYKFKIGAIVTVRSERNVNAASGVYRVTKQLPDSGGECEYRIKSVREPHERVARRSELTKA
jgi:hypothetical protein